MVVVLVAVVEILHPGVRVVVGVLRLFMLSMSFRRRWLPINKKTTPDFLAFAISICGARGGRVKLQPQRHDQIKLKSADIVALASM